jgi:diguanylate cyclase (GGDEF)-like protein
VSESSGAWYRPIVAGDRFATAWWATVLSGLLVALVVWSEGVTLGESWYGFGIFAGLVIFWDLRPIITSGGYDPQGVNLSTAFVFAALLRWGLGPALLILAAGTLAGEIAKRKPAVNAIFNVAQYTLCYTAAWLVMSIGGLGPSGGTPGTVAADGIVPMVLAWLVYHLTNLALVSALLTGRTRRSFREEFLDDIGYYTLTTAAVLAVSPLLVVLVDVELVLIVFLVPPLLAVQQTAAMSLRQEHNSQHDVLTGLANRKRLERVVTEALEGPEADDRGALVLLDLDRFKQVNDTLGHQAGDELLVHVSDRLRREVRDGDVVARLGGDEFAVWLSNATRHQAEEIARRLREQLEAPFELSTMVVDVDASVGIARYPSDGDTLDALLRCADVAMYAAKDAESGVEVYARHRDPNTVSRLELVAELRRGIAEGELTLHYQPQISFTDRAIVGVEALVRWVHPTRGEMGPADFLALAEQAGLMREVTDSVVAQALSQAAEWRDHGLDVPVAVNITPRDLADARFAMTLAAGLAKHDLDPCHLRLEVTEHTLMDALGVESRIAAIAELGLKLSLDDFGTGYSSFSHLRRLPVTELKIDRSFVREVHESDAIVRSIVQLAHNLGLRTVAEGVETAEDWRALKALGCDVAQGYLFSRPVDAVDATACLVAGRLGSAGGDPVGAVGPQG